MSSKQQRHEQEQLEQLEKLYYEGKAFVGEARLYSLAVQNGIDLPRRAVRDWLQKQETWQMMKPTKRVRSIKRQVIKSPFKKLQIDLVDLSAQQTARGMKWLITAIDGFSKMAYAVAMPDKREQTVLNALKQILEQMHQLPSVLQSDNGSEFVNKAFKAFLQSKKIKHILSTAGKPQTNGLVERFNGTIKRMIKADRLDSGVNNWDNSLDAYLRVYNQTPQDTTKQSPENLESEYLENNQSAGVNAVRMKIKKNAGERSSNQRFKVGDWVRVRLRQERNQKSGENWSKDLFTVRQVLKPRMPWSPWSYQVEGLPTRYFTEQLQKVDKVEHPVTLPDQFIISSIVRPSVQNGERGYVVRWAGYKDPEWTGYDGLIEDVPKLIEAFEKQHKVEWKQHPQTEKWTFKWKK